jgi:hypothetical protein
MVATLGRATLTDAERDGKVRIIGNDGNGSNSEMSETDIQVKWTVHPIVVSDEDSSSKRIEYIPSSSTSEDIIRAFAPEMVIRRVGRKSNMITCHATYMIDVNASKKTPGAESVADDISALLVENAGDAAEVAILEKIGARPTLATSERVKTLEKKRYDAVANRSPYGIPTAPVLEQFVELSTTPDQFASKVHVNRTTYPEKTKELHVREIVVSEHDFGGVRFRRGDRMIVGGTVFIVTKTDPEVILQTPPVVSVVQLIKRREIKPSPWNEWSSSWILTGRSSDATLLGGIRVGDDIVWTTPSSIDQSIRPFMARVVRVSNETNEIDVEVLTSRFESALTRNINDIQTTRDWVHPHSVCSADATIMSRTRCLKIPGAVWDRPCEHGLDCPFFDPRTGRGGCLGGGQCEVPIGVERVGYRHSVNGDGDGSTPVLCWKRDDDGRYRAYPNRKGKSCDRPVYANDDYNGEAAAADASRTM